VTQSTFAIGGLATGMDTQSIIDKLVQLESRPLTSLQQRQAACSSQVSLLGALASSLGTLQTAADGLATGGVVALRATSSNTAFSAAPGTGAVAGSWSVRVDTLATAAKWRSAGFGAGDAIQGGTLSLTVGGKPYLGPDGQPIAVAPGESLSDIAAAIRATGAPVSATVLDDGSRTYLSLTNLATGYAGDPSPALAVAFAQADPETGGVDPTAGASALAPTNASFSIDGLTFTRPSNTVSDALPGTTLALSAEGGPAETLAIGADTAATRSALQKFVDAYNGVMAAAQKQLAPAQGTDRASTLAGDSTVRGLAQRLSSLISSRVGAGTVRSLADLGVKTQRDGTLSLDSAALDAAVARDPGAVDALFSDASSGIAHLVDGIAGTYTASTTGLLVVRQGGLQRQITDLGAQATALQARIDAYRDGLVAQFTAMEQVVGQLKTIGAFLTSQQSQGK
jgi:flagellar hook-associated protein 2